MKKILFALAACAVFASCTKADSNNDSSLPGCWKCRVEQITTPNAPANPVVWWKEFCGEPFANVMKFQRENTWRNVSGIVTVTSKVHCFLDKSQIAD